LVEETRVPGENYRSTASHEKLYHIILYPSTPRHKRGSRRFNTGIKESVVLQPLFLQLTVIVIIKRVSNNVELKGSYFSAW